MTMPKEFMKNIIDSVMETREKVEQKTNKISKSMDESLHSISFQIGKTIDVCRESSTEMKMEAELKASEIAEEMKKKEDLFFKSFTQQIKEVIESYPTASAIAGGSVVLLALPPTRRLLWRSTIGRFESEEQAFAKLTRRAQTLKDGAASADVALKGFSPRDSTRNRGDEFRRSKVKSVGKFVEQSRERYGEVVSWSGGSFRRVANVAEYRRDSAEKRVRSRASDVGEATKRRDARVEEDL